MATEVGFGEPVELVSMQSPPVNGMLTPAAVGGEYQTVFAQEGSRVRTPSLHLWIRWGRCRQTEGADRRVRRVTAMRVTSDE